LFESFIKIYGYYAVFIFACIEGEIAVLTAGFLCRQGLMSLQLVMLFAFLGTLITEQCLFFVGRIYGVKILEKYPKLAKKSRKVIKFLKKYDSAFIFGSRFIYGIRNVSPIIIGTAQITPLKFSTLNIPAALIWSVTVAGAGYIFANVLESAKESLEYIQIGALIILCAALIYFFRQKTKKGSKFSSH
jgi:membrane protein DedA with SNARE-associated domain